MMAVPGYLPLFVTRTYRRVNLIGGRQFFVWQLRTRRTVHLFSGELQVNFEAQVRVLILDAN